VYCGSFFTHWRLSAISDGDNPCTEGVDAFYTAAFQYALSHRQSGQAIITGPSAPSSCFRQEKPPTRLDQEGRRQGRYPTGRQEGADRSGGVEFSDLDKNLAQVIEQAERQYGEWPIWYSSYSYGSWNLLSKLNGAVDTTIIRLASG